MRQTSAPLLVLLLSILASARSAAPPPLPPASGRLACSPMGECEVCPPTQRSEPACRVYGNRRLVTCIVMDDLESQGGPGQSIGNAGDSSTNNGRSQAFSTYEPCARAIEVERKDFWEFVLANISFALVALFIVVIRGRMIAARHYNQLVSKIGFPLPFQLLSNSLASTGNTGSSSTGPSNVVVETV